MSETDDTTGQRPPIWTGHLGPIDQNDPEAAKAFYQALGLRLVHELDQATILEMRGGTHLVLRHVDGEVEGGKVPFDFMVEDLASAHAKLVAAGLEPGPITDGANHQRFTITDPSGHRIPVFDSHVVGIV